ncbi:MAG: V-type ATPase 116kDa subunit family protein, partial [Candidatus Omnitrophica bacterium]|nr:V-type ATPase 116kDa subunit family protein [Candidatus Omnitrophota bacterium]
MAISRINKIEIIGLRKDQERILALLQKLGIIELLGVKDASLNQPVQAVSQAELIEIEETIACLAGFQQKGGMFEGMVKLRPLVYKNQLEETVAEFDYRSLLKEMSRLQSSLRNFHKHREHLDQERHLLSGWRNLDIPLDEIHSTKNCGIILGVLNSRDYVNLLDDCEDKCGNVFFKVLGEDKTNTRMVIFYMLDEFEQIEPLLKKHRFDFVTLSRHKGIVQDRLYEINREILVIDDQIQDARDKIAQFSTEQFKLMVVYDYLLNTHKVREADVNLAKQKFTFSLSGWIRHFDIKLLEREINSGFQDMAVFISEPNPEEDIPIALENKTMVQPFEAVTNLYGQPKYNGVDPTRYLAPFFALSFGFCLLDAGYGLILFAISIFFLNKKQLSPSAKNFLKLFLFMSISAIFAGLITGSFFGDLISRLPGKFLMVKNIQKSLILFDPVKDSLLFLGLTLAVGFTQVWIGVFIRFLSDFRKDKFTALVLDLPTLLVQTSLLMLALVFAKVLPAFMMRYVFGLFILAAATVIFYQWKSNKEISLKIFWSFFGIYSI